MVELKKEYDSVYYKYERGSVEITDMKKKGDETGEILTEIQAEVGRKQDALKKKGEEANDIAREV